ncbi:hypothetical protein C8J57DRAFT_1235124 [Mycena rebaudengoi]|nr:hypothetical protein C8J57DRAFT_1235124 [Mycena rebaudengoi]
MAARSRAPARQTPLVWQSPPSPPSPPRSAAPSFGGGRPFGRLRDRDMCYECGLSGHWAQDFPMTKPLRIQPDPRTLVEGADSDGREAKIFATCLSGHWAQDCPNGSLNTSGQDICFNILGFRRNLGRNLMPNLVPTSVASFLRESPATTMVDGNRISEVGHEVGHEVAYMPERSEGMSASRKATVDISRLQNGLFFLVYGRQIVIDNGEFLITEG